MVAKVEPPRVEEEIVVEEAPAAAEPEVLTAAKEQKDESEE
jgi:hypothetical protein